MLKILLIICCLILCFTSIYSVNTSIEWNHTISSSGDSQGNSIDLDSSNNLYSLGTINNGVDDDIYIISYDSSGTHRWNETIDYLGGDDSGELIKVDSSQNIYLLSNVNNGSDSIPYLMKKDSSGNHLWNQTIEIPSSLVSIKDVSLDSSNNIYLIGEVIKFPSFDIEFFIISYDSSGTHRWNKSIAASGNIGRGHSLEVDGLGNIYAVGSLDNGPNDDFFVISYDSSGTHRWNQTIDYLGGYDNGFSVAIDSQNNPYFSGRVDDGTISYDFFVIGYDSLGVHRWNRTIDYAGEFDVSYSLNTDSSDNVYASGYISDSGNEDFFVISYDSLGVHRWNKTIDYAGGDDTSYSILMDSEDNTYISGKVFNGGSFDFFIISYDSSGLHRWNKTISDESDGGNSLINDNSRNVYGTGIFDNGVTTDFFVYKISEDQILTSNNQYSLFPLGGMVNAILIIMVFLYLKRE